MIQLNDSVKYIKGVGPNKVILLNKLGIYSVKDLLYYFPRNYEDRGKPKLLADIKNEEEVLIEAVAVSKIIEIKSSKFKIYKLNIRDEMGTLCVITWFNQTYLKNLFELGGKYKFYGKVINKDGKYEMKSPVFDAQGINKNTGKIIPIYPLTYNLSQNVLRGIVENGLKKINYDLEESIPEYIKQQENLMEINEAIHKIHFPNDFKEFNKARERLVFEELLGMQLALLMLKNRYTNQKKGIQFDKSIVLEKIINQLPFELTNSQKKVIKEINQDMESKKVMNRLLQGDVGSGKTIVSIIAAYKAVKSGYQVAIMAPTAILASQHLESFREILGKYDIKCELLISSVTKKQKEDILKRLNNGEIDILIGTHSLLEESVQFKNMGLVVTDEQHRFGVRQREIISLKGDNPNVLVMTATPIPRTLALILYGDLDISIIDELPPNRKKIETYAVTKEMGERINIFVKKQIKEGRQCYIVCPLVEENEEIQANAVKQLADEYKNNTFKEYNVEYIHGKLKPKEKDIIMNDFKNGKIDILISTTVIEVGVNVPNASLMIVENAERFGLAGLHQLRGRVGRGEYQSFCILKYDSNSEISKQRMKIMESTNNGFIIAEKDLELRGSGDFFGTKQHGLPELKIANLFEDMEILKRVQSLIFKIEKEDSRLDSDKNFKLKELINNKFNLEQLNL